MYKYRAEITKGEEIRYISHLDYAALVERAFCRSRLPITYSEGFNQRMKLAFASALAVGVTSDAEYLDFELTKLLCQPEVFDRLSKALPGSVRLLRLKSYTEKHQALMAEADLAKYEITLPLPVELSAADLAVKNFNAADRCVYHRVTPKKTREIEVKQYMKEDIRMQAEEQELKLWMDIVITQSGSIKPGEILHILQHDFAMPIEEHQALIVRRALLGHGKPLIELIEE